MEEKQDHTHLLKKTNKFYETKKAPQKEPFY